MILALPLHLPPIDFRPETAEILLRQIVKLWGISWVRRMLEHLLLEPADAEVLWTSREDGGTRRCYLLRTPRGEYELQLWRDDRFVSSLRLLHEDDARATAALWQKDLV